MDNDYKTGFFLPGDRVRFIHTKAEGTVVKTWRSHVPYEVDFGFGRTYRCKSEDLELIEKGEHHG